MKKISFLTVFIMLFSLVSIVFTVKAQTQVYYDFVSMTGNMEVTHNTVSDDNGLNLVAYRESGTMKTDTSGVWFDAKGINNGSYEVSVTYKRFGNGMFKLSYTDINGKKRTAGAVYIEGDPKSEPGLADLSKSQDATYTFLLENADFTANADFEINAVVNESDLKHGYSKNTVYIKNVSVSKSPYKHYIEPQITSNKTGNIFYDNDIPEFDIVYKEISGNAYDFNVVYDVYLLDENMEIQDAPYLSVERDFSITAKGRVLDNLILNVDKFGLYKVIVTVTGSDSVKVIREIDFSKCVGNENKNESLGVNVKIENASTDEKAVILAKNAGFGILRESIGWSAYEDKATGNYGLKDNEKRFLLLSEKYGFSPLVIINSFSWYHGNKNGNIIAPEENFPYYYNYVKELMSDELMQNVKHIEIHNEPNAHAFMYEDNGQEITVNKEQVNTSGFEGLADEHGEVYAKVVEKTVEAVNDAGRDDVSLGILSLAHMRGSENTYAYKFSDAVFKYLQKQGVIDDIDAITYHPYSYWKAPEADVEYQTDKYNTLAGTYKSSLYDNAWHTEFGWSTSKYIENVACIGDEFEQAKLIVRQYAFSKAIRPGDIFMQYDLVDDGARTNTQEAQYGLLNSIDSTTPLSAKFSYLAMSNMNNLIGSADTFETVVNTIDSDGTSGDMVLKFSDSSDKEVYMLWSLDNGTYPAIENAVYYDIFGNTIDVENTINLTDAPIYAVCGGMRVNEEVIHGKNYELSITGESESVQQGVPVSVIVTGTKTLADCEETDVLYMNETLTDSEGKFSFFTKIDSDEEYLNVYVSADGYTPMEYTLFPDNVDLNVKLVKEHKSIRESSISFKDLNDISVIFKLPKNVTTPVLYSAYYNDSRLIFTDSADIKHGADADLFEYNLNVPENTEFNKVQIFFWDMETLSPICSYVKIEE